MKTTRLLAFLVALAISVGAQTFDDFDMPSAVVLPTPKVQFLDANGKPLAGGKVYFYQAGTTTPQDTYTSSTGATPNANPVILDSAGRASIWIKGESYKVVVQNSAGVAQWTEDNVTDTTFFYLEHLRSISDSALLTYKPSVAGTVPDAAEERSVPSRLSERLSVKDFGAIGDGLSHPVSEWCTYAGGKRYTAADAAACLTAIQADYPDVAAVTDVIDTASINTAIASLPKTGTPYGGARQGTLHFPSGTYLIASPITLADNDGNGSNRTYTGDGLFSSTIRLANGANSSMLLSGAGKKSRTNISGLHFEGNYTNQTSFADCVVIGEEAQDETAYFWAFGVRECNGNGLSFGDYDTSRFNIFNSFFAQSRLSNISIESRQVNDKLFVGGLVNTAERHGVNINTTSPPDIGHITLFGERYESNNGFGVRNENSASVNVLSGYHLANPSYFGQQSRGSAFSFNSGATTIHDAGFYNVVRDNFGMNDNYYQQFQGALANRGRFPVKEDYMDVSAVTDWDMVADGVSAWTAGANATATKTSYISGVTGQRYLRVECSVAPCEVTQDVSDTLDGSMWFRLLYSTSAVPECCSEETQNIAGIQIRRSDTDGILVDSGWLSSISDHETRPDYAWETTAGLPGGSWRVALRCNSTDTACLFTDVRLVKNYISNPGFEDTTTGWTISGSTCSFDAGRTGWAAVRASDSCTVYQQASLSRGEYYLVRGWVKQLSTEQPGFHFGYGQPWIGTQVDGRRTHSRNFDNPRLFGEWQLIEFVVRADDFIRPGVGLGAVLQNGEAAIDDVAIIHMSPSPWKAPTNGTLSTDKKVGVGTTTPLAALHVVNTDGDSPGLIVEGVGYGGRQAGVEFRSNSLQHGGVRQISGSTTVELYSLNESSPGLQDNYVRLRAGTAGSEKIIEIGPPGFSFGTHETDFMKTFATLNTPGFRARPIFIYCSDCTVGATCSGSGTGAWAFFSPAATAWKCPF